MTILVFFTVCVALPPKCTHKTGFLEGSKAIESGHFPWKLIYLYLVVTYVPVFFSKSDSISSIFCLNNMLSKSAPVLKKINIIFTMRKWLSGKDFSEWINTRDGETKSNLFPTGSVPHPSLWSPRFGCPPPRVPLFDAPQMWEWL